MSSYFKKSPLEGKKNTSDNYFTTGDFLKMTKLFFNFGPELVAGKSPLESIGVAINYVVKVIIVFSTPLIIVCVLTQFLIGGANFSLKSMHWKFEKMNPISGSKKIFSV